MKTLMENVRGFGKAVTIDELNASYLDFIRSMMRLREEGFFKDMDDFIEMEHNVTRIANNNIVRIARAAYESFKAGNGVDTGQTHEVRKCLDSLWGFDLDHTVEESLLQNYYDRMMGRL